MKQVISMNWGTAYGSDYVNRLYRMVRRNVTGPLRFVCLTDDRSGIQSEVECHDCPTIALPSPQCNLGWRKLNLWDEHVSGLADGSEALFLDLDIVITENIDSFFDYRTPDGSDFIVARNWTQKNKSIGNTSVYRFTVGSHPTLLSNILENTEMQLAKYPNSQTYISSEIGPGSMSFWPDEWCCSFKVHCVPKGVRRWFVEPAIPQGVKVVAFPGVPNPHDAVEGNWPSPWYKKFYKHIRPTRWVAQNWQ